MEALLAQAIDWVKDNPNWSLMWVFVISISESLAIVGLFVPGVLMMGDHGGPDRRRGHRLLAGGHRRRARGHRRRRPELLARALLQGRHPPHLALQPLPGDPQFRGALLREVRVAEHRLRALRRPGAPGDPGGGRDDGHDADPIHRGQRHLRPALGPGLHTPRHPGGGLDATGGGVRRAARHRPAGAARRGLAGGLAGLARLPTGQPARQHLGPGPVALERGPPQGRRGGPRPGRPQPPGRPRPHRPGRGPHLRRGPVRTGHRA